MKSYIESDQLALVVDEFLMLVQETADYNRDEDAKTILNEARQALFSVRSRLERAAQRYVVAIVGLSNVGKSTLLNALLGSDLAPRRNGPCTAAPIEFAHGDDYRVTAYYRDQIRRPMWLCEGVEDVHDRLAALADDSETDSARSIHKVVVAAPHPLLAGDLVIADTPGDGAAQSSGAPESHDEALRRYLQEDISQVFLVVLAEQGIGKREKSLHDQFCADVCNDVVVTGCEDWSPEECQRFRRRFSPSFSHTMPVFHFVSGLEGLKARAANDLPALEAAGIPELECRIRELAERSGRNAAIQRALLQLADDVAYWMHELIKKRGRSLSCLWRPDSWDRWVSFLPDDPLVRRLTMGLNTHS